MKTLVFGAGFLGHRLASSLAGATLVTTDIADGAAVRAALDLHRPEAVINAAGKTGKPNVDWCESHKAETLRANVQGALELATACGERGVYMLHLGSGCIFYGPSPREGGWREDDHANPSAFYSRTKYSADLVLSELPHVGIARLRMPIDAAPGARNLITKLANYRDVIDVENSVTVVDDLVRVAAGLIERRATGVFHATNPGTMRHRDLLALYTERVDRTHTYNLITADDLVSRGMVARARSNCVLSSARLDALGLTMRPIAEALRDCMDRYAAHARSTAGSAAHGL